MHHTCTFSLSHGGDDDDDSDCFDNIERTLIHHTSPVRLNDRLNDDISKIMLMNFERHRALSVPSMFHNEGSCYRR